MERLITFCANVYCAEEEVFRKVKPKVITARSTEYLKVEEDKRGCSELAWLEVPAWSGGYRS